MSGFCHGYHCVAGSALCRELVSYTRRALSRWMIPLRDERFHFTSCSLFFFVLFMGMEMGTVEKGSGLDTMIPRSIKRRTAERSQEDWLVFMSLIFISLSRRLDAGLVKQSTSKVLGVLQ